MVVWVSVAHLHLQNTIGTLRTESSRKRFGNDVGTYRLDLRGVTVLMQEDVYTSARPPSKLAEIWFSNRLSCFHRCMQKLVAETRQVGLMTSRDLACVVQSVQETKQLLL